MSSAPQHRRALDDDFAERWDRDMKRTLAGIRADAILRDLARLKRAWRQYQRLHPVPAPGQLDLFTQPATTDRHATI